MLMAMYLDNSLLAWQNDGSTKLVDMLSKNFGECKNAPCNGARKRRIRQELRRIYA